MVSIYINISIPLKKDNVTHVPKLATCDTLSL